MHSEEQTRSEIIPVRVTPAEAAQIRTLAKADMRPTSQWARVQLLQVIAGAQAAQPSEVRG